MFRLRAIVLLLCVFGVLWLFLPHLRYAKPFSGKVTDSQGHPLKDAVVMVGWRFQPWGGSSVPLILKEARTDSEGRYRIEGWGPILNPFSYTRLGSGEPTVSVIHPAYRPIMKESVPLPGSGRSILNVTPSGFGSLKLTDPLLNSRADRQYAEEFDFMVYKHYEHGPLPCRWPATPMFVKAMRLFEHEMALREPYFAHSAVFC